MQKLLGAENDKFGDAVSLSNKTALIGAPRWYTNTNGLAYIFTCSGATWTQQAELSASDGRPYDSFGHSVSLSGDTALIGGYPRDSWNGSVYVFIRTDTNWSEQAELTPSDAQAYNWFGFSVSLSGDIALIGTPNLYYAGKVYVFVRTGTSWIQQAEFSPSDSQVNDCFGQSVSLSGDTALIGAPYGDIGGAAYVFIRNGTTWIQQQKLIASDGVTGDTFGSSVSLSGDTAIIGAPGCNSSKGATFVFTHDGTTWTQQQKITASDGETRDFFGNAVSLSDCTAFIGANIYDGYRGAVYGFTRDGTIWTQQQELSAPNGTSGWEFGTSVSHFDDTVLIGTPGYENAKGAVYVFVNEKPPYIPMISGPSTGKPKYSYNYTFNATDPNGDNVSYYIDWGDNTSSGWLGSFASGLTVNQSHTWKTKGTYMIKAKAKDINGAESDWGFFSVTMPYELPQFPFIHWLLERFPNAFPILRYLLYHYGS